MYCFLLLVALATLFAVLLINETPLRPKRIRAGIITFIRIFF